MKTFITLFVLFFSYSAYSETWSCIYEHNNKSKTKIMVRDTNNKFYDIFEDSSSKYYYETIKENSNHIVLIDIIEFGDTYAIYLVQLDKKKKGFSMVGLQYENPNNGGTDIISGRCKIF